MAAKGRQSKLVRKDTPKKTYTITFGDVAENHARMQKIGELAEHGWSREMLEHVQRQAEAEGIRTELVSLHTEWMGPGEVAEAWVLILRNGAQGILHPRTTKELMEENDQLDMDKHALMKGRVVNKHARWNLCFAEEDQEPEYETGKGRVVAWRHIPLVSMIREKIGDWTSGATERELLNGEANYYYDISTCGIGYHGDGERKKVFAVRMGASMPLYYQWYQYSMKVGDAIQIELHDGDMYMMSEKAVGFDWLKKNTPTLRHATGCKKFTDKDM